MNAPQGRKGPPIPSEGTTSVSRRQLGTLLAAGLLARTPIHCAAADGLTVAPSTKKATGLTNERLKDLVEKDIKDRQFLVTGELTRLVMPVLHVKAHRTPVLSCDG